MADSSFSSATTKPLYRGTQIVWYVLGFIEVLLAFRFVLKFLGANPEAGFSSFVYGITYVFATPFLSVFRSSVIVEGSVFEWTTILAMFAYWVIAVGIIKLFLMGKTVSTPEAAVKLNDQETDLTN
ncbi:MAG: YggT family protein [Patescibacteria group bacterium]